MKKKMLRNNVSIIIMAAIMASGCVGCGAKTDVAPEPAAEAEEAVTEEVFEEPEEDTEADIELMDYYGRNIDEIMSVIPNLEITAQEGIYDKDGAQYADKEESYDGISLSGPFFDVDKDSNIVGITYSGRRFVLCGLCAAVTMEDARQIVRENGWEFSDVEFAHGTAQAVANYTKGDIMLSIVSTDDECEFGNTGEEDIKGSVESVSVTKFSGAKEAGSAKNFKELVAELSQAGTADSFALIDVDGDGTPELAAADSVGELRDEGNAFLFIEGNGGVTKLLSVNAGFDGAHIYVAPGKNTILETGGMMGNEFYTVYKINGMELEKIKELQAACDPETDKYTYYDGETKISDKQFADEFAKAISDLSPYTAIDSDGLNEVKITYKDSCVDYETASTGKYMTVDELKEKL